MSRPSLPNLSVLPLLPFLSLLLFQPPAPAEATASGHFSMSGQQVHIYNLVGKVEVVPGPGSSVTVDLAPGGRDAAQLGTRTWNEGGTFFVVTYPSDHLKVPSMGFGSSTSFRVANDGTFGDHPKRGHSGRQIRIDGHGNGLEAWCDMKVFVPKGQTVTIHLGTGEMGATNVDGDVVLDAASANVTSVGSAGKLLVDTGSGSITVNRAKGVVSLDSGSGAIRVTDTSGDRLLLDTGSGDVTVVGATATRISADTGSGRVEMSGVSCPTLHIDTGSGGVRLGLLTDVNDLSIDTGSGSVTIEAPASLGAALHFETGSGSIDSNFPLRVTRRDDDTLMATVGDGLGRIDVDTGSGSVRLVRAGAH